MSIELIATLCIQAVSVIVWLAILGNRVKQVEKENERQDRTIEVMQVKHEALDSEVIGELTAIKIILAKIQGKMGID